MTDTRHAFWAIFALALGGFAIGTTEFVTMGLLPQIAAGVDVDIPTAGHVVSAYALGVVVGAPLLAAVTARAPRRAVLICLMVALAVAHVLSALASSYGQLMAARFLSGVPHGAYFGAASLVAASLVSYERRTHAVSLVLAGLTVANVIGVPVGTALGQRVGWQWPYAMVAVIAVVTALALLAWVPRMPGDPDARLATELSALRHAQVWFALAVGTIGFGGSFAMLSYIAPTLTELTGLHASLVPVVLVIYGLGMTTGALLAGRVSRVGVLRGIVLVLAAMAIALLVFSLVAGVAWCAVPLVFLLGVLPSMLVPLLQTRLMDVAREGQSLAAALNHSTLNIANALGAWLGGVVLAGGHGYAWPSRVGALLAVLGVLIALASGLVGRRGAMRATAG